MFYGFSFDDHEAHCREGYEDAEALLHHLDNVGPILEKAFRIVDVTRLEVHAPESQLRHLREPMADLNAQFFALETGFRRP